MDALKDVADEDIYECLMSRLPQLDIKLLNKKAIGWTRQHQIAGYRKNNTIAIGNWLSEKKKHDTTVHEFGHWLHDQIKCPEFDELWDDHKTIGHDDEYSVGYYIGCPFQHHMNKYELFACAFECYINGTHTAYGEYIVLSVLRRSL